MCFKTFQPPILLHSLPKHRLCPEHTMLTRARHCAQAGPGMNAELNVEIWSVLESCNYFIVMLQLLDWCKDSESSSDYIAIPKHVTIAYLFL